MKKSIKRLTALLLVAASALSLSSCQKQADEETIKKLFTNTEKISYSVKYTPLSKTKRNSTNDWRQGMVSGNGMQGFVTSGDPYSDTFIFQNMHFIMPNENVRYCPETFNELETVKQCITKGEDIVDNASYDDVYRYHPGGQLRLDLSGKGSKNYVRYTDYETGITGVYFENGNNSHHRQSFTSMADNLVVTKIKNSDDGQKLNIELSYDDISTMANFGDSDEKNLQYKKIASPDGAMLSMVAHYPDYENSELKNGGYATVTYVISVGGNKSVYDANKNTNESQYVGDNNPAIKIENADEVYLITKTGRTHEMGALSEFKVQTEFALIEALSNEISSFIEKYNSNDSFDFDGALKAHLDIYQPQFNGVTLSLEDGSSTKSNEALLSSQRHKKSLNADIIQRAYYSGRYLYLCCAGYSTSRLYGMWTGEWNTGWGSKYTMDANVNLQTSSMNTSNMSRTYTGYVYFILRQLPDWEENAYATHGFKNAIQAPVNSDGDKAVITETCYPYPFRYWNAGASWMIQPLYETLKCYGNVQIPISDEFDLLKLKSVLSVTDKPLTDEEINAILDRGYMMLREDILLPLLTKSANYWQQLMTEEYYTDESGKICYEKGKSKLNDNETYAILPSYSPENNPSNYPSPSTANCAIDIAACRNNLEMLLDIMSEVTPDEDTSKWTYLLSKLPPYLYDETGALKEWGTTSFKENNEHRHLSHLYCAWPLDECQNNEELRAACIKAIENRESENEASHALVHRSLIAARLKDRDSLTAALTKLMNHKIHYDSLATNHDYDRGSCYCTDFGIGYLGIINESLVYSDTGIIEVLPAIPTSGFDKGSITGLMARTNATIDSLSWDLTNNTATVTITSHIDQTIKVSCKQFGSESTITIKAGETKTVEFK